MEEEIRKQGLLFLQQQKFGKRWRRVWSTLYRESSCSISRLEFFECKDGGTLERSDRTLKKQQENKKVIRLSDCIRVTEMEDDSCPRDCSPFLIETTDKIYIFSSELCERDDWVQKLCEIAFPWSEAGARGSSSLQKRTEEEGMEDNSLYSGRETVRCSEFRVVVRRTEVSERCRLKGPYLLRTELDSLQLRDLKTGYTLFTWPYRFLRRFGRDKVTFSFEAGRRCESGEGSLEFDTKQGQALFQAVESAINLQRGTPPPSQPGLQRHTKAQSQDGFYSVVCLQNSQQNPPREGDGPASPQNAKQRPPQSHLEPPIEKRLTGAKSLTLDPWGAPPPRKHQVKPISSCPLLLSEGEPYSQISPSPDKAPPPDLEYSLPFDTLTKTLKVDTVTSSLGAEPGGEARRLMEALDPLYDSIDESAIRAAILAQAKGPKKTNQRAEHIYDEPEGCAVIGQTPGCPTSLYDNPEEVRGQAWRIMGSAVEPKGHEYPYNPQVDDYAVPKVRRRAFPSDMEEESPYDNVMVTTRDHQD
ncbi:docking protein 2 [Aplochiton taeniatus]